MAYRFVVATRKVGRFASRVDLDCWAASIVRTLAACLARRDTTVLFCVETVRYGSLVVASKGKNLALQTDQRFSASRSISLNLLWLA